MADKVKLWRVWVRHLDLETCGFREGKFTYYWTFEDAKAIFDATKGTAIESALQEVFVDRNRIGVVTCEDTDCSEIHLKFDTASVLDARVLEGWDKPAKDLESLRDKCRTY